MTARLTKKRWEAIRAETLAYHKGRRKAGYELHGHSDTPSLRDHNDAIKFLQRARYQPTGGSA